VAQGVKLLTLKEGEKLQDISLVIPDGEDAGGDAPEGAPSDGAPASAGLEESGSEEDAG
jgi:DNA gyrase subunit A